MQPVIGTGVDTSHTTTTGAGERGPTGWRLDTQALFLDGGGGHKR